MPKKLLWLARCFTLVVIVLLSIVLLDKLPGWVRGDIDRTSDVTLTNH